MDKDEGIRALSRCFGDKWFSIADISDERIREIAPLFGVNTTNSGGLRRQLGKQLTNLHNCECEGLRLVADLIPQEVDPSPNRYQIQTAVRPSG